MKTTTKEKIFALTGLAVFIGIPLFWCGFWVLLIEGAR